jgi:hypothetical protein
LSAFLVCGHLQTVSAAEPVRFQQDRLAIGFWFDPPADEQMEARYAEIAEANFTLVIGGFGARTPEQVRRQIALCEKYDMRALVARAGLSPDQLPTGDGCWGYMVRDEPNAADFPAQAEMVAQLRKARPGKMAYINLFPNYASPAQLGTATYDEHVERFAREVDIDVLSMDHYPIMRPDADGRDAYCANLEVMRRVALERDIPFWNFFTPTRRRPSFAGRSTPHWRTGPRVFYTSATGPRGAASFPRAGRSSPPRADAHDTTTKPAASTRNSRTSAPR